MSAQLAPHLRRQPVEPTPRGNYNRQRLDLFVAQQGRCAICNAKQMLGDMDLDHRIALDLGGADEPGNWRLICRDPCHREKTKADRKAIAKAARLRRDQDPATRRKSPHRLRGRGFQGGDPLKLKDRP